MLELEETARNQADNRLNQLSLFEPLHEHPEEDNTSEVEDLLEETDPDDLTPRQALDLLFEMKKLLGKKKQK